MAPVFNITIWDTHAGRIAQIERNLLAAMKRAGVRVVVDSQSEPPMVSRMNLLHRVPTLEVDGMFWTLEPGETISEESCLQLLTVLKDRRNG